MGSLPDSRQGSKGGADRPRRWELRGQFRQEETENREIFGDAGGNGRRPRRLRREESQQRLKEYEAGCRRDNRQFRQEVQETVLERVGRKFQEAIGRRTTAVLGRADGEHRDPRDRTVVPEECSLCGTHRRSRFFRDGYSKRSLQTRWGKVALLLPRIRCDCGGTVRIAYAQFAPWQRRFEDMQEEILGLSALCLSLRQIRAVLDLRGERLSITTVCKEIGKVADLSTEEFKERGKVPPVVLLDGIWGYLAEEVEEEYVDKRGHKRTRKVVRRVPLLVAWGVWPGSGKKALLGWEVGKEEDAESWEKLLELLRARGIHADHGLRLFVSDGSSGLLSALALVSLGPVAHQRCVFHKIRNVVRKVKGERVEGDAKASREKRKERRLEVLADLVLIWQAADKAEAQRKYEEFVAKWEGKEPEAVACLRNGFEATVVFYDVQAAAAARGEHWEARHLRTTSGLERANRSIRAKLRASTIFQTPEGLRANVYLALGARGKSERGEFQGWVHSLVVDLETLRHAA